MLIPPIVDFGSLFLVSDEIGYAWMQWYRVKDRLPQVSPVAVEHLIAGVLSRRHNDELSRMVVGHISTAETADDLNVFIYIRILPSHISWPFCEETFDRDSGSS